ncbi:MAG: aldehyde dehydrogenase family protein, partial [Desulfovibrio sp.]|nr:aldehyde dehydrogenase family protein [Desulfovibrio sp.]
MDSTQHLQALLDRVRKAQRLYAQYTQEQVDAIFHKVASVATANRIKLAKMAVDETGMGILEDKVIKNHFSSEYIYHQYKDTKTCGIIEEDEVSGFRKIAAPLGIVAGIIPTTNPTSTTIFKALLALKTRNGIIFSPHPRAMQCIKAAAMIILQAAVEAGA